MPYNPYLQSNNTLFLTLRKSTSWRVLYLTRTPRFYPPYKDSTYKLTLGASTTVSNLVYSRTLKAA